jgi:hypothetical protein
MTTPDIAGLCERLRRKAGFNDPVTGEYVNFPTQPDGPEAANTLERQAAEIARLRGGLERVEQWVKMLPIPTQGATAMLMVVQFALTGEDTATFRLSGETQTDDRTRRDA